MSGSRIMTLACHWIWRTCLLIALFAGSSPSVQSAQLPEISRRRVAVFYETNFPGGKLVRDVGWFEAELKNMGLIPRVLDAGQVSDAAVLSTNAFDTLILPKNDMPFEAEYSIVKFLIEGGNVVSISPMPTTWRFNTQTNGWESKQHVNGWYAPFQLRSLPFDWAQRKWSRPLSVNMEAGAGLTALLPPTAGPFTNKIDGQPLYFRLFDRWDLHLYAAGRQGDYDIEGGENISMASNLILPLYLQPNGEPADFIVYRYHNVVINGSTLVVLGQVGSKLLAESSSGAAVLRAALLACESRLPDEQDAAYYERLIQVNREVSDLGGLFMETQAALRDAAFYSFNGSTNRDWQVFCGAITDCVAQVSGIVNAKQQIDSLLAASVDFKKQDAGRKNLLARIAETRSTFQHFRQQAASALKGVKPPAKPAIRHPLKTFVAESYLTLPYNLYVLRESHFRTLKLLGIDADNGRIQKWYPEDPRVRAQMKNFKIDLGTQYGYSQVRPSSGELNPSTGTITESKPQVLDYAKAEQEIKATLEAWKDCDILRIDAASETGLKYKYWGSQAREEYQKYLGDKYADIAALNAHWQTTFTNFADIALPTRQPATLSEHCNWEHWRNFREQTYEQWVSFFYATVKKYAPNVFVSHLVSTMSMESPLYGVNFYNLTKYQDINGMDGTAVNPGKEWIYLDLTRKPVMTGEWGGLYSTPGNIMEGTKFAAAKLWEEVSGGFCGINLWIWNWGGFGANYVDFTGLPTLYGWTARQVIAEFKQIEHILLDGVRAKPEIGILFSNTTRVHDQGWGAKGKGTFSKHVQSVINYYTHFLKFHRSGRVIPEEMLLEGEDLSQLRLLVMPQSEYLSKNVQQKLVAYVRNGGNLLVEGRGGRFDNFGHSLNLVFEEAGIVPAFVKDRTLMLDNITYALSAQDDLFVPASINDSSQVLASYADGQPALVSVPLGKGRIVFSGFSFGLWKYACADEVIDRIWKNLNIAPKYVCSNDTVLFREWRYDNSDYLICTWRAGAAPLEPVEIKVRGRRTVRDYLFGRDLPVTYDGQYTCFTTLLANGGRVFQLAGEGSEAAPSTAPAANPAREQTTTAHEEASVTLPYEGYIYDEKPLNIEGFTFQLNTTASGDNEDQGEAYLIVSKEGEKQKKRMLPKTDYVFNFRAKQFRVHCDSCHFKYPFAMIARIDNRQDPAPIPACSVMQVKNILTMDNGFVRVRLDADQGGRIIEFCLSDDQANQVTRFGPTQALSEHDGRFPGSFINRQMQVKILKDMPDESQVQLEMTEPFNMVRLKKILTLRRGEAALDVQSMNFNHSTIGAAYPLQLVFHAELNIGGQADEKDLFVIPEIVRLPFLASQSGQGHTPKIPWAAIVDRGEQLAYIDAFNLDDVEKVYLWMDQQFYTLELFGVKKDTAQGQAVTLRHRLLLLRGVSGLDVFQDGIGLNLALNRTADQCRPIPIRLEVGSAQAAPRHVRGEVVLLMDGRKVKDLATFDDSVALEQPLVHDIKLQAETLSDGAYELEVALRADGITDPLKLRKPLRLAGKEKQRQLLLYSDWKARLIEIRKNKGDSQKKEIFETFVLLEDFKTAAESQTDNDLGATISRITERFALLEK